MMAASDFPAVKTVCSKCATFQKPIEECKEARCCYAWARAGHAQRLKDDARIAAEKDAERKTAEVRR